jgi:exodeoxyribonuclease VII small subunit
MADPSLAPNGAGSAELPYADALAELEAILASLETAGVDVDTLATQVARATYLIGYCRERLETVRVHIADVLDADLPDADVLDAEPPAGGTS